MPRGWCWSLLFVCLLSGAASAQEKEPIGHFAIDVRGIFARYKVEPVIASALGVQPGNLPKRSWGLIGGVHFYPLRLGKITLGAGVTYVSARGKQQLETVATDGTVTTSPETIRHFTSISPEISLNFGSRRGWSYVSGGMFGQSQLYVERADAPASNVPKRGTINYGGGARWFAREHLAFSVDARWYSLKEAEKPDVLFLPASVQPATTVFVIAAGISIK
jgi:hypothetical protein